MRSCGLCLRLPSAADREAVSVAVTAMYRQWLDSGAKALQKIIGPLANAQRMQPGPTASTSPGTVTLFVDGLRLDISRRVQARLADAGLDVSGATASLRSRQSPKRPSRHSFRRRGPPWALAQTCIAANVATGTKASIQVLRSLMADNERAGPRARGDGRSLGNSLGRSG